MTGRGKNQTLESTSYCQYVIFFFFLKIYCLSERGRGRERQADCTWQGAQGGAQSHTEITT